MRSSVIGSCPSSSFVRLQHLSVTVSSRSFEQAHLSNATTESQRHRAERVARRGGNTGPTERRSKPGGNTTPQPEQVAFPPGFERRAAATRRATHRCLQRALRSL